MFRSNVGTHISKVFLTEFRSAFPTVRITTRDPSSTKATELSALGATVISSDTPLADVFQGADVVINTLSGQVSFEERKKVVTAIADSNVKVFFLNEFGT